jgi:hypothetical protein
MKRLLLIAVLAAAATPTMAQPTNWTSSQIGPFTHYSGTDNQGGTWTGTGSQIGQFRHDNFYGPNGQTTTCTTSTIGQFTHTNCN